MSLSYDHHEPIFVAVDAVISFYKKENNSSGGTNHVLLIKRKNDPWKGQWAFPGGMFETADESLRDACVRETLEETSIVVEVYEALDVRDEKDRDPRGRVISHPFRCHQTWREWMQKPLAKDDASEAKWFSIYEARRMPLAGDHNLILLNAFWEGDYYETIYPGSDWQ